MRYPVQATSSTPSKPAILARIAASENFTIMLSISNLVNSCGISFEYIDGMAEGAVKALTEFGLEGKVMVTGQDAELSACHRLIDGTQCVTIYKPFKKQGETAAIIAMKVAKGEQVTEINTKVSNGRTEVPSILLEPIPVDKSILKNTVIADGFYKESELFNK